MRLRITILVGLLLVLAGCSTDDPTRPNTFVPLTSIEVTGTYESMADGTVNQYRAIGNYSGRYTRDLTAEVDWLISNSEIEIASVSIDTGSEGLVTALAPGETTVTAVYEDFSESAPVIVTDAFLTNIAIKPQDAELQADVTKQYEATGTFSDGSSQDITSLTTWESSATGIATINNAGLATAIASGTTTISGAWQGITSSTGLLVTGATLTAVTVTPEEATIAQGTIAKFKAEATFSDGSTQNVTETVDWQSSDNSRAVISTEGLANGVAPGEVEISATYVVADTALTATASLTVSSAVIASISVTPEDSAIEEKESQQFTATGTFSDDNEQDITELASWRSVDNTVGTISNSPDSRGLFTSIAAGTTVIEADFDGVMGETVLTVGR